MVNIHDPSIQVPDSVNPLFDYWMRDTLACSAPDDYYYITGTTKYKADPSAFTRSPGIHLWRSKDLKNWEDVGIVWNFKDDATWQKAYYKTNKQIVDLTGNKMGNKRRTVWAPSVHYLKSQENFFIVACTPKNPHGNGSFILRSISGKAEGPYENIDGNKDGPIFDEIDGNLFEDTDETVYFLGHDHYIARMKSDMSGLAEPLRQLDEKNMIQNPIVKG